MNARRWTILGTTAVILAAAGTSVLRHESRLRDGRRIYLELAPVDPRSLMQGDYMALDYAVARQLAETLPETSPRRGVVPVRVDARGVATWDPAATDAVLAYVRVDAAVHIGTDAYYFEEGTADAYATARYGEFRVSTDGQALLVGLVDEQLAPLGR